MGELVDLDRHRHRLRDELAELEQQGCVQRNVSELAIPVETWRRAARAAGRTLGRRVQTRIHPSGSIIWAVLADWPATPDEQICHKQGLHEAIHAIPDLTGGLVLVPSPRRS